MRCWLCDERFKGKPIVYEEILSYEVGGKTQTKVLKFNLCSEECRAVLTLLWHFSMGIDYSSAELHVIEEHGISKEVLDKGMSKFNTRKGEKRLKKVVIKLNKKILSALAGF